MARQEESDDDLGQPLPYDPDFHGPRKHRSCTDVICLMLFIVFIGCWIGIALYAFTSGNPNILLVPKDSYGSRCGLDEHVKNKPYLFFFDLTKCFGPLVPFTGCPTPQVCVEKCPSEYFYYHDQSDDSKLICNYQQQQSGVNVANGKCAKWYLPSKPFLNRCLYNIADRRSLKGEIGRRYGDETRELKKHTNKFELWVSLFVQNTIGYYTEKEEWLQVGQNVVDDLVNSWWQILVGFIISLAICILYILMMRWLAAPMVWLSLLGVIVLLGAGVYFSAVKYIDLKKNPVNEEEINNVFEAYTTKHNFWLVILIIASVVLLIVLLMLIFLRKRILLAIALIKEGSKAVSSVISVLFFPLFPWILQMACTAFAIACALYLATTGKPLYKIRGKDDLCNCPYQNGQTCEPKIFMQADCLNLANCQNITCKFITMENPVLYPYLQTFNLVAFFWSTFFSSALGQMILASVFATWYWTWNKTKLPFFAVLSASGTTLRFHIGTLAFGSLIITICRLIRVMLEYIDRKAKKYDNGITKAILGCCKCFFWCLEKFLKFINRNAYIMCAIHGKNFCSSAKDAFLLLMRNIIRVFVLDKVTDFLFFLGKLFITIGVGALSYFLFATDLAGIDISGLNYNFVPIVVIMIVTYFIATMFFNVYSMAVDTLFLCFLEDCERNDGSTEKPYYMSKNLMKIFGKKNKQH